MGNARTSVFVLCLVRAENGCQWLAGHRALLTGFVHVKSIKRSGISQQQMRKPPFDPLWMLLRISYEKNGSMTKVESCTLQNAHPHGLWCAMVSSRIAGLRSGVGKPCQSQSRVVCPPTSHIYGSSVAQKQRTAGSRGGFARTVRGRTGQKLQIQGYQFVITPRQPVWLARWGVVFARRSLSVAHWHRLKGLGAPLNRSRNSGRRFKNSLPSVPARAGGALAGKIWLRGRLSKVQGRKKGLVERNSDKRVEGKLFWRREVRSLIIIPAIELPDLSLS